LFENFRLVLFICSRSLILCSFDFDEDQCSVRQKKEEIDLVLIRLLVFRQLRKSYFNV